MSTPAGDSTPPSAGEVDIEKEFDEICQVEDDKELAEILAGKRFSNKILETLLLRATRKNKLRLCRLLLSRGVDLLGAKDSEGNSALHIAARAGNLSFIKLFVSTNSSMLPKLKNKFGATALEIAKQFRHEDCIQHLLQYNPYFDSEMLSVSDLKKGVILPPGIEALKFCVDDDLSGLSSLIEEHPMTPLDLIPEERETQGGYGVNALHLAAYYGSVQCLTWILDNRVVNVNSASTEERKTPLHFAVEGDRIDVVRILLANERASNVDVNAMDKRMRTPLHYTVDCLAVQIPLELVNRGADVLCRDAGQNIPFHYAADRSEVEMLAFHAEKGGVAALLRLNTERLSPLDILVQNRSIGNLSVAIEAIKRGTDGKLTFSEEEKMRIITSIRSAIIIFQNDHVRFLLEKIWLPLQMSIDILDSDGLSFALVAARCGNSEMLEILQAFGSSMPGEGSESPLRCSLVSGESKCTLILLEAIGLSGIDIEEVARLISYHGMVLPLELLLERNELSSVQLRDIHAAHLACAKPDGSAGPFLRYLNSRGFDFLELNDEGDNPLHVAARTGLSADVISILVEFGVDVHARTQREGLTALFVAVFHDNDQSARALIDLGASGSIHGERITALHLAASVGAQRCLKVLLENGMDVFAQSSQGETPLYMAVGMNHSTCISPLVEASRAKGRDWTVPKEIWENAVIHDSVEAFYQLYQLDAYAIHTDTTGLLKYVKGEFVVQRPLAIPVKGSSIVSLLTARQT